MLYIHCVIRKQEREKSLTIFMDDLSLSSGWCCLAAYVLSAPEFCLTLYR